MAAPRIWWAGAKSPKPPPPKKNGTFANHHIDLQPSDRLYLFSDGYPDQVGGPRQRKIMRPAFYQMLQADSPSLDQQHQALSQFFDQWRGPMSQTDDVLVIGLQV